MHATLREPDEFQHVYRNGKRYDGVFITVFVIDNQARQHRFGVTASKKVIGNAVERNRAKRLLRETFRSSATVLSTLSGRYDWVLNARAKVLNEKLQAPLREFGEIVAKVEKSELLRK